MRALWLIAGTAFSSGIAVGFFGAVALRMWEQERYRRALRFDPVYQAWSRIGAREVIRLPDTDPAGGPWVRAEVSLFDWQDGGLL